MEQDQKLNLTSEQQVWFNKIRPQVKEFIEETILSFEKNNLPKSNDKINEYEAFLYLWINITFSGCYLYIGKKYGLDTEVYSKSSDNFKIGENGEKWEKIRLTTGTKKDISYLEKTMLDILLKENNDIFKNVKATGNTDSKGVGMSNNIKSFLDELNNIEPEMVAKEELTRDKVIRLQIKEDVVDTNMINKLHDVLLNLKCSMKTWKDPMILLEDWADNKSAMGNGNHSHDVAMMEDDCTECKVKKVPRKTYQKLIDEISGEKTLSDGKPENIPLGIQRALFRTNPENEIVKKGMSNLKFAQLLNAMSKKYGHPVRSQFSINELKDNKVNPKRRDSIIELAVELEKTEDYRVKNNIDDLLFRYDTPLGKFVIRKKVDEMQKMFPNFLVWGSSSAAYKLNDVWSKVKKDIDSEKKDKADGIFNVMWHPNIVKKNNWLKDRYKEDKRKKDGTIVKGKKIGPSWESYNEEHIKKCYIQNEQFNIKTVEFIYMDMFPSQKQIAEWDAEFQEYKKKKKEK